MKDEKQGIGAKGADLFAFGNPGRILYETLF
ncbi:hypothetical protein P775_20405 [Puniceibacterium antarcticum]|uniref:Uncharacterized protein n=1 Tax=Puniceibacterium antarcticum TaxID=1206336 RepID=A0A2G8R9U2_9RHOB|nr:hypothetical protein P775_20405 [Puniceibacterium antarcticum]